MEETIFSNSNFTKIFKSTKSNEESPQKPTFTTSQIWDEQELHDDEEGENEQVMEDESLNGISTSPFWTQSIAPGKYYNRVSYFFKT